jgi:hypothetical protein
MKRFGFVVIAAILVNYGSGAVVQMASDVADDAPSTPLEPGAVNGFAA